MPDDWRPIDDEARDGKTHLIWLRAPWACPALASWYQPWSCWVRDGETPSPGSERFGIGSNLPVAYIRITPPPES